MNGKLEIDIEGTIAARWPKVVRQSRVAHRKSELFSCPELEPLRVWWSPRRTGPAIIQCFVRPRADLHQGPSWEILDFLLAFGYSTPSWRAAALREAAHRARTQLGLP